MKLSDNINFTSSLFVLCNRLSQLVLAGATEIMHLVLIFVKVKRWHRRYAILLGSFLYHNSRCINSFVNWKSFTEFLSTSTLTNTTSVNSVLIV